MDRKTLLKELEALTHSARSRRMLEVGRLARTDAKAAGMLAELERGGFYERRLALIAAHGSREGEVVARALADSSRYLRRLAFVLAPVLCADEQLEALFPALKPMPQVRLVRRLHQRRRMETIGKLLAPMNAGENLVELLPYAPRETVERCLAEFRERADAYDWLRLSRRHPEVAAALLRQSLAETDHRDRRFLSLASGVLAALAERDPNGALALVPELLRKLPLSELPLEALASRRPREVTDLILELEDPTDLSLDGLVNRLDTPSLIRLLQLPHSPVRNVAGWFHRVPPGARREIWEACAGGWRDQHGCVYAETVALLPRDLRYAEARRHLALPLLATRPLQWFPYAALLPWEEALAALTHYLGSPDADLRGPALAALVRVGRYHRECLTELLARVRARANEQDPVRMQMLSALAALPPGAWRPEHLETLAAIIRAALDASDLSYGTASQVEQLLLRMLPFHPEWVADWLGTLVKERGHVSFGFGARSLSESDVRRIAPALLPVLRTWETREREGHLIQVGTFLGKRLKVFDGLADILERRVRGSAGQWTAVQALWVLEQYRPDRFPPLVEALVRKDASWVTQSIVHQHLHRRRQDLLTPHLGQTAFKGRFSTGKTRFVLPFASGFQRWTPGQQEVFAGTLGGLIGDRDRDTPGVLQAIRQLRGMLDIPVDRLAQLAGDRREVVRDTALYALGSLDAGQGVPALIEALGDDRARVAIYALRSALLEMDPEKATELLREVPTGRVTVAKEVTRVLGDLGTEGAFDQLLALEAQDLHRDVRVALLRALWEHLERDAAWPILERAAASEDAALAQMAGRTTARHMTGSARRKLAALLAGLLAHPDPVTRLSVLTRLYQDPVSDPELTLREPLVRAIKSGLTDERSAGAQALLGNYSGELAPVVSEACRGVPRLVLVHFLQTLLQTARVNPRHLRAAVQATVDRLDSHRADHWRVRLAAAGLGAEELGALLQTLTRSGLRLHPGVVFEALSSLSEPLLSRSPAAFERLLKSLTASEDESLRRIALGVLIQSARDSRGWNPERRALLERFREDPSAWVAEAALFTFSPEDDYDPAREAGGTLAPGSG